MWCSRTSWVVLLFVFVSQFSFAQNDYLELDQSASNSELWQNLQGEWFLSETEIVDGYAFLVDTNRFVSVQEGTRKIVFKGDSISVYPFENALFYRGLERDYQFEIEYDTLFSLNVINLYKGRKRKREFVEDYPIKKCDRNELIIQSFQSFNSGLDEVSLSIYYTYRKEGVDSLLSQLSGEWQTCTKEYRSFLFDTDSSVFVLTRQEKNEKYSQCEDHYFSLEFKRNRSENICWYSAFSGAMGGGSEFKIKVDPKNKHIYFDRVAISVFNIIEITENELILSFNPEETEALRTAAE